MKQILLLLGMLVAFSTSAQVGYQVSLLDTKTGEPRTNEKVTVSVKISDNNGKIICDETKSVTSDSFGVLSLTIGNENTFTKVDWSKLPLTISASVDGTLIGSSTILNVPIAEHAKHTGILSYEMLGGKSVSMYDDSKMTFSANGTALYTSTTFDGATKESFKYEIDGNNVYVFRSSKTAWCFYYSPLTGKLYMFDD